MDRRELSKRTAEKIEIGATWTGLEGFTLWGVLTFAVSKLSRNAWRVVFRQMMFPGDINQFFFAIVASSSL